MRATILPKAILLTNGQGVYCGLKTASSVFLIFLLPNYTNIFSFVFYFMEGKNMLASL